MTQDAEPSDAEPSHAGFRAPSRAAAALEAAARAAVDFVYPPTCLVCDAPAAEAHGLCASCWRETPFIAGRACDACAVPLEAAEPESAGAEPGASGPAAFARREVCARCAEAPPPWRRGRAVALHQGPARALAVQLKYADRTAAARAMGAWMARAARDLFDDAEDVWVTPTPLHWRRRIARRGDQAAILARRVALEVGAPYLGRALQRVRATRSQVGLDREARALNLAGAFTVSRRLRAAVAGRRFVLVDDVSTTGATLAAATAALLEAGAAGVDTLVFAKAGGVERVRPRAFGARRGAL